MMETIIGGIGIATALGLSASVYYRLGKLEERVELLYNHINICVDWIKNNKK